MSKIDLKQTKIKLAIMFAIIVFCVSFVLVFMYFSFKFLNILKLETQIFSTFTTGFEEQKEKQGEIFLNNFFNRTFELQKLGLQRGQRGLLQRDRERIVFDFVIINEKNEIIYENLKKYINLDKIINISNISSGELINKSGISFYKTYIGNNNHTIFIYFYSYPLQDYLKDLGFFSLLLVVFSFLFYYIGFYFAGKNLKPVEETFDDMNDFIHNANHELKTPISVISSNLQLIKATKNYDEELINNSITEIKRIDDLILGLSNLSDISSVSEIVSLNLEKEINEIIKELEQDIAGKNLILSVKINKNIFIEINREYFYIMFSNLLRNAIKYNFENGEIDIILDKNKLSIGNTGNGISPEDLPLIFNRFFKGEKSRNSQGFGIGLSLVKKICDIYNWKISVLSNEKITIFEIRF